MIHSKAIWHDRKRNCIGLPWTFTIYELTPDKLYVSTGIFNTKDDECRLYRITDLTLTRTFWQRIIGTGTIHCDSADKTLGNFDIVNIRDAKAVKEKLSDLVEDARMRSRVYARESVDHGHGPGAGSMMDPDDADLHHDGHDDDENH